MRSAIVLSITEVEFLWKWGEIFFWESFSVFIWLFFHTILNCWCASWTFQTRRKQISRLWWAQPLRLVFLRLVQSVYISGVRACVRLCAVRARKHAWWSDCLRVVSERTYVRALSRSWMYVLGWSDGRSTGQQMSAIMVLMYALGVSNFILMGVQEKTNPIGVSGRHGNVLKMHLCSGQIREHFCILLRRFNMEKPFVAICLKLWIFLHTCTCL